MIKIEAATRLKADLAGDYSSESKDLTTEKKNASPERKEQIKHRQEQLKTYKEQQKGPADADHTGMKTKPTGV